MAYAARLGGGRRGDAPPSRCGLSRKAGVPRAPSESSAPSVPRAPSESSAPAVKLARPCDRYRPAIQSVSMRMRKTCGALRVRPEQARAEQGEARDGLRGGQGAVRTRRQARRRCGGRRGAEAGCHRRRGRAARGRADQEIARRKAIARGAGAAASARAVPEGAAFLHSTEYRTQRKTCNDPHLYR